VLLQPCSRRLGAFPAGWRAPGTAGGRVLDRYIKICFYRAVT
jgi:hypothetical protein